jgi:hypothetical protein
VNKISGPKPPALQRRYLRRRLPAAGSAERTPAGNAVLLTEEFERDAPRERDEIDRRSWNVL